MAGLTIARADLDQRLAQIAMGARDSLRRASELCAQVNDTSIIPADPYLQNTLGYTAQEVTWIRSGLTDLGGTGVSLYRVANGLVAGPVSPNPFFFNAQHWWGFITS